MPLFNFQISKSKLKKKAISILKWLGSMTAGIVIVFIFFEPLKKEIRGPEEYLIYVVGDFSDSTAIKVKNRLKETLGDNLEIGSTPIKLSKVEKSDYGDPETAADIASNLAKKDNVLFIVGHFFSSTTKNALPKYMEPNHPIAVILTTETNPFLVPSSDESNNNKELNGEFKEYRPIYSLSPDDVNQSKTAAAFAITKAKNFWIIQDSENKVYSNFLAKNFKNEIQKQKNNKVLLLTDNNYVPAYSTIKKLGIDGIFFAGDWTNALVTIRQVNSMFEEEKPLIVLSDGCVNKGLLKYGDEDIENVFLTHPLTPNEFSKENYGIYGIRAGNEIIDIVERANSYHKVNFIKKWLNIHRVNDARDAVRKAMHDKYKGDYRVNTDFHIWKVMRDTLNNKYTFNEVKED